MFRDVVDELVFNTLLSSSGPNCVFARAPSLLHLTAGNDWSSGRIRALLRVLAGH